MDNGKSKKLIFTFSNSGVVKTFTQNPELIAELSSHQDSSSPRFSSLRIVQTPDSGFELVTDIQSQLKQWIDNLKAELEMPDDGLLRHLTISGAAFGPRWQNYNLRFVGVTIEQSTQTEYSCPFWRISDTEGNHIELVQAWYRRVSCMSSPVYCDVRWQPKKGRLLAFLVQKMPEDGEMLISHGGD